jgi:hypothetical protein
MSACSALNSHAPGSSGNILQSTCPSAARIEWHVTPEFIFNGKDMSRGHFCTWDEIFRVSLGGTDIHCIYWIDGNRQPLYLPLKTYSITKQHKHNSQVVHTYKQTTICSNDPRVKLERACVTYPRCFLHILSSVGCFPSSSECNQKNTLYLASPSNS